MEEGTLNIILGGATTILTLLTGYLAVRVKKSEVQNDGSKVTNQAVNDLISNLQIEIQRISSEKSALEERFYLEKKEVEQKIKTYAKRISELEKKDIHKK